MDNEGTDLKADGSDFVTVVAAVADKNGNIKRLNNYNIRFSIEGEGRLLGGPGVLANPVPVKWGTAPVLVQSTLKPGKIRITASVLFEGSQMPISGELEFESKPSVFPLVYDAADAMRGLVRNATTVICMATMLHTIATGNMTPSFRMLEDGTIRPVYLYTIDIDEFVVNKLLDRGSLSATTMVTNVQDFITLVAKGLGVQ